MLSYLLVLANLPKHRNSKNYIREIVSNGEIILQYCKTKEQFADILTKPLGQKSFDYLRKFLGMQENAAIVFKGEC